MQTTGQFDIVIQMPDSTQAKPNAGTPAQPMQENEPVQEDPVRGDGGGKSQTAATVAMHTALNAGKQAAMAAISNIGLATGNSALQQRVQSAVSTITKGVGYATAIVSGNWAIAVGMLASDAIGFVSEMYQEDKNRQIANYSAEQYARKLGYTNGRR
jgi:hypothetical protein